MGALDAFASLFADSPNKVKETKTGVLDMLPELSLDMSDEELLKLSDQWMERYANYYPDVKKRVDKNLEYWKGKHESNKYDEKAQVDNLIFEALETFLPLATKKNPEPFVRSDDTPEGQTLAKTVQNMLIYHADRLRMKLRLKRVTRDWAIKLIGVKKHGWSEVDNDITSEVLDPTKLILDSDGTISCDMEYTGSYIGEPMQETAANLIERFPSKEAYIRQKVDGKLGTKLTYVEWWSCNPAEYVFWRLDKEILGKTQNPHWNYGEEKPEVDEFGVETVIQVPGFNHFNAPKAPYTFLGGVYSLGDHPHDDTSLIEQSIPMQDIVNKRQKQIDVNADSMNGGLIVSGEFSGLTKDQATDVTEALRGGGTVWVTNGKANEAVYREQAPGLPGDIFQQLADVRQELRSSFGTAGSNAQGLKETETAHGKQLVRETDSDRIGGGITEYLEQFSDAEFNWWVQLMAVYYDEAHTASVVGAEKAMEFYSLINTDFKKKLTVSVKEGSLIPDSDAEKATNAKDLLSQGNLDPITAFDQMGFPNPKETAARVYQWKAAPQTLFPDEAVAVQEAQLQEQINQQAVVPQ